MKEVSAAADTVPPLTPEERAFTVITEQADLVAYAEKMAQSAFIAWDTEFARGGSAYHPELCLIQCMTDKDECAIIDPIAGDLDLTVLRPVFENPDIIFLGHALRQDIEVSLLTIGCAPACIWDTQIAGFFCGETEYRGYAYLVEQMLGVVLSKQLQYSNWKKRPLSAKQLEYAALDVRYPAEIYARQLAFVKEKGTEQLVFDEGATLHRDIERQYSGEAAFRKMPVRDAELFTDEQAALLSSLCVWREAYAMRVDLPRKRVLADDMAVLIAQEGNTADSLQRITADTDVNSSMADDIVSLTPAETPFDFAPGQYKVKPNPDVVTLLLFALRSCAEAAGVSPEFIASKAEIKGLAAFPGKTYNIDSGWRKQVFGTKARAILNGDAGVYLRESGMFDVR